MLYVDTSIFVAAYVLEVGTTRVQLWLNDQPAGQLAISEWVVTEVSSALAARLRSGSITVEERSRAQANFRNITDNSVSILGIERSDFQLATRFCDRYDSKIRAADALHLAIASHSGATL